MQKGTCDRTGCSARIWLLYMQGRLSPVQLLALCKVSAQTREKQIGQQSSAA